VVFAQTVSIGPDQIWAPVLSAVLVALIGGVVTVMTTRRDAKTSADDADDVARLVRNKNAVIDSQEERICILEAANQRLEERCQKLEEQNAALKEQVEMLIDAQRNASLLERELNRLLNDHGLPTLSSGSPPDLPEPS
jgi:predicted RNase H-like nuclease (RuvC/YqgF family)